MDYELDLTPEAVSADLSDLERRISELDAKALVAGQAHRRVETSGLSPYSDAFTEALSVNHCADSQATKAFFRITAHLHVYQQAIFNHDLSEEMFEEKVEGLLKWAQKILYQYQYYAKSRERYLW